MNDRIFQAILAFVTVLFFAVPTDAAKPEKEPRTPKLWSMPAQRDAQQVVLDWYVTVMKSHGSAWNPYPADYQPVQFVADAWALVAPLYPDDVITLPAPSPSADYYWAWEMYYAGVERYCSTRASYECAAFCYAFWVTGEFWQENVASVVLDICSFSYNQAAEDMQYRLDIYLEESGQ